MRVRFWNPATDEQVDVDMDAVPRPGDWVVLGRPVTTVKEVTWYPTRQDEDGDPVEYDVEVNVKEPGS